MSWKRIQAARLLSNFRWKNIVSNDAVDSDSYTTVYDEQHTCTDKKIRSCGSSASVQLEAANLGHFPAGRVSTTRSVLHVR